MGGVTLSKTPGRWIYPLFLVLLYLEKCVAWQTPICSQVGCSEVPSGGWRLNKPIWMLTHCTCSDHKGDSWTSFSSHLCLGLEPEVEEDLLTVPPQYLSYQKWQLWLLMSPFSCFWSKLFTMKLKISISVDLVSYVPIPVQTATSSAPVPSLQLLCTLHSQIPHPSLHAYISSCLLST